MITNHIAPSSPGRNHSRVDFSGLSGHSFLERFAGRWVACWSCVRSLSGRRRPEFSNCRIDFRWPDFRWHHFHGDCDVHRGSPSRPDAGIAVRRNAGIPHPLACAFVGDVPNVLAVAGWDADGNGVLVLSEFAAHQEARRVAYHVLVKNSNATGDGNLQETEEQRRRRRARGWKPSIPETPAQGGLLQVSDETSGVMQHLMTNEMEEEDFCEVVVETPPQPVIDVKPATERTPTSNVNEKEEDGDIHGGSKQGLEGFETPDDGGETMMDATQ